MNSMVHKTLAKFRRIYDLQANGRVFDTPEALWGKQDYCARLAWHLTRLIPKQALWILHKDWI